MQLKLQI